MNLNNYVNIIKEKLSPERASHSLRVVDTALSMSARIMINREKVHLAALLHDYAKELPPEQMLGIARSNGMLTCKAEEVQPDLLHGPVGAFLCSSELGVYDEEVLQAIRFHTTGHPCMTMLDTVIYMADLIEPGRKYTGVAELRELCAQNLGNGLLYAFDATLTYVLKRKFLIHPLTVQARNWLLTEGSYYKDIGGVI